MVSLCSFRFRDCINVFVFLSLYWLNQFYSVSCKEIPSFSSVSKSSSLLDEIQSILKNNWQSTLENFFEEGANNGRNDLKSEFDFPEFRSELLGSFLAGLHDSSFQNSVGKDVEWIKEHLYSNSTKETKTDEKYSYWSFMPSYTASVIPKTATPSKDKTLVGTSQWKGLCFQETSANLYFQPEENDEDSYYILELNLEKPASLTCYDFYFFATTANNHLAAYFTRGVHTIKWTKSAYEESDFFKSNPDLKQAVEWDFQTKGIRIFQFYTSIEETLVSLYNTILLLKPTFTGPGISMEDEERNANFLQTYANFEMEKITDPATQLYDIQEKDVQSGDFFGILRLDGLDPLLGWAMGSTTGHTVMALWIDEELYICESQVKSSYWPTDNVQRTPFRQWLKQAAEANYHVVHVPLRKEYSMKFNSTMGYDWFSKQVEGLKYGYHNLIFSWLDTSYGNYPCLPPEYNRCLDWELVEVLFALLDRPLPHGIPPIADLLWIDAFNFRLADDPEKEVSTVAQVDLPRTHEIFYNAEMKKNVRTRDLPTIVEQDSWQYHTTKYNDSNPVLGESMVCCVFVCHLWKAAGLFEELTDSIQCGELTNFDDYSMNIFTGDYKQIMGTYVLNLNDYNKREIYSHMDETCPSQAPDYIRPSDC